LQSSISLVNRYSTIHHRVCQLFFISKWKSF
jgi:hypothetical protein